MSTIDQVISQYYNRPIFFVTPDTSQAIGMAEMLPDYHIITNTTHPLHSFLLTKGTKIFVHENVSSNTEGLMADPQVQNYIKQQSIAGLAPIIICFKPSHKIEKIAQEQGWSLAASSAHVNRQFEDKLWFFEKYHNHPELSLPAGFICTGEELSRQTYEFPLVAQTSRGWAGNSTSVLLSQEQLDAYMENKSNRPIKFTQFIKGPTYTLNACVSDQQLVISPIAAQINPPTVDFAINPASTCGRYWQSGLVNTDMEEKMTHMTQIIAEDLLTAGYRGFFGLDFLISEDNQVYLLEVNPRLTASESFYTRLQLQQQEIPLMLLHLMATLNIHFDESVQLMPTDGIQIVMRNTSGDVMELTKEISGKSATLPFGNLEPWNAVLDTQFSLITQSKNQALSPNHELFRLETKATCIENHSINSQLASSLIAFKQYLLKNE